MRYLYTLLLYLSLPFILTRLLWRARKNRDYAKRWGERFGYCNQSVPPGSIWLHAVSVGETLAAVPLIKALRQQYPTFPIILTNTTPTGSERAKASLGNDVIHCFVPYDIPRALNRFLNSIQPRLVIIMETELWPNLLHCCAKQKIPVMIANARLSEKSAKGYGRIRFLTRPMLQHVTVLAVQTPIEAERFIALGAIPANVHVTGSIKFDLIIPEDLPRRAKQLRTLWGNERPVFVAASTHESEEEKILMAFALIRKVIPNLLLVLVPRHPERFAKVKTLCQRSGYSIVSRSDAIPCSKETAVFVGDTMGELLLFYAAADIAFVGGSFVEVGGHNPLEPAALSIPVFMGPQVFNFTAITEQLCATGGLIIVASPEALAEQLVSLLQDTSRREAMGQQARAFVLANRGALSKHLALAAQFL